jgi:sarcosine oxidase, subunit beta
VQAGSGVNAGTLTMQMTRAALIPYAMPAWDMWMHAPDWLDGADVLARAHPGLSAAFTAQEAEMLTLRRAADAPIELVSGPRACGIEPGLNSAVLLARHCPADRFATAYLTSRAFRHALVNTGVDIREDCAVRTIDRGFVLPPAMSPSAPPGWFWQAESGWG